MKLKSVHIKDFRRFTDLTVKNIPETAKLIILAGPNGSGKSSFFDALSTWYLNAWRRFGFWDWTYHEKFLKKQANHWDNNQVKVEFHDKIPEDQKERNKALYLRSAYRNEPEFQLNELTRSDEHLDHVRIRRTIDNDQAVRENYQRLASKAFSDAFEDGPEETTFREFRIKTIGTVKDSVLRLFPDLELNSIGDPLTNGTFRFTKGVSKGFLFKNLSGGEKAAFDLILDLVVARRSYDDTLFCIDEPEAHMNARIQANLLNVLHDLIPDNCQLLLATHSIGMMRRARDIERANPGTVAFLDFDSLDFDKPQIIEPAMPDRIFWEKAYKVALDDLAALVAPERVVICEGGPKTRNSTKNQSHDARCYDTIFSAKFPETQFVSMGNAHDVERDRLGLGVTLGILVDGLEVVQLIDRDDRSNEEIEEFKQKGVRVLQRRNIESYFFDDEVLTALADKHGKSKQKEALLDVKKRLMDECVTQGKGTANDVKPIRGQLYNECKSLLGLTGCGNTAEAFMRDTLAPLIKPDMTVYEDLKHDIFGAADNTPASAEKDSATENP